VAPVEPGAIRQMGILITAARTRPACIVRVPRVLNQLAPDDQSWTCLVRQPIAMSIREDASSRERPGG
jgi:hypothetical protein